MAMTEIQVDFTSRHIKTYASEARLRKRLDEDMGIYPDYHDRFVVVRTPEGRWTAIVTLDRTKGGYVGRYEGFLKI